MRIWEREQLLFITRDSALLFQGLSRNCSPQEAYTSFLSMTLLCFCMRITRTLTDRTVHAYEFCSDFLLNIPEKSLRYLRCFWLKNQEDYSSEKSVTQKVWLLWVLAFPGRQEETVSWEPWLSRNYSSFVVGPSKLSVSFPPNPYFAFLMLLLRSILMKVYKPWDFVCDVSDGIRR
jgi:hypothetical protein